MFNNIIYFIVVLLIFSINYPDNTPENSLPFSLSMFFVCWFIFAGYCRFAFLNLQKRLDHASRLERADSLLTSQYHSLIAKFSVLAVFLFGLDVYLFSLKAWIQMIPVAQGLTVLQGGIALSLFFFYLSTIWYFAYPAYRSIIQHGITRRSYIQSNLRLNFPILFPWMVLSFVYDLIALSPWFGPDSFMNSIEGQIVFFAIFLTLLMIFMPMFVQYWWGCKPLQQSEKANQLVAFLREKGFKCRHIVKWPIFEGRMMTAGIMGILPRYRYILITDSLLEVLSVEELKAVLAHEMGHAKYRHLLFYILFFVGFMALSFGLYDLFFYIFSLNPSILKVISGKGPQAINLFYLLLSVPMLMTIFVYFRYIMGFFMRNFERQADLYSSVIMGTPGHTISSLEKIALLSGKTRDLPSWHHFSIRERVDYLWRTLRDPGLIRHHNRFVFISFLIYLGCMGGLTYLLNFGPMKQHLTYDLVENVLNQQLLKEPQNINLYQNLAMVYQQTGKYQKAIVTYEKIIALDPNQGVALNNLAWLLVTAPSDEFRDNARALDLAKRAVALKKSPVFLDTLAEAYYANGSFGKAVETCREAVKLATKDIGYYKGQLKKFLAARG